MSLSVEPKLLSHPWYRKWERGELPLESLHTYVREYYWQVAHFPRYLSRLHSQMAELKDRQAILTNLLEEENTEFPHPVLWLDFAEALGLDRNTIQAGAPGPATQELIDKFNFFVGSSPAEGLGAILAYESQVPEIARFKSDALKKYYLKNGAVSKGTRFFRVHEEADVWHTQALVDLVSGLSEVQKQKAQHAANQVCSALWIFLDGMPY